jgi:Ca-activated chloride channel family protein
MLVRVIFSAIVLLFCNLSQAQNSIANPEIEALPALTLPPSILPSLDAPPELPTIFARVDEVNLVLSVTNDHGHFVRDLDPSDIVISDNGEPPAKITYFQTRTDLPLRVALMVDTSDSVAYRFAFEIKSAEAFLKKVLRPKDDAALIVGFNQIPTLVTPPTADVSKLSHGLRSMKPAGETALYDAIAFACDRLREMPGSNDPVRRVIVLVTDGEENRSRISLDDAVEHALHAESVIYVVNTKEMMVTREDRFGEQVINRLAQSTGGRVLAGRTENEVSESFHKIQEELRSQYALGYRPRSLIGNLFHPIRIFGPKGIRIRTRQGYYAR